MTLAEFLLARIAADEAKARDATPGPWRASDGERNVYESGEHANAAVAVGPYGCDVGASAEHIARHDPARVLAEVDAKRRIVTQFQTVTGPDEPIISPEYDDGYIDALDYVMKLLALPYAGHRDYRPEWRP